MREVYQLSSSLQKDIYIGKYSLGGNRNIAEVALGSTHVTTPKGFIDDLKVLELGGAGSKAIPNGLRDMRGETKSFQELYDTKYYVKDALLPPVGLPQSNPALSRPVEKPLQIQPSPTNSFQGSIQSATEVKDDKKKKRGFFGFR